MVYIHPILFPSLNYWGECYALMAADVPINCNLISHVITAPLPFTIKDIKIKLQGMTLRYLTQEVSKDIIHSYPHHDDNRSGCT